MEKGMQAQDIKSVPAGQCNSFIPGNLVIRHDVDVLQSSEMLSKCSFFVLHFMIKNIPSDSKPVRLPIASMLLALSVQTIDCCRALPMRHGLHPDDA